MIITPSYVMDGLGLLDVPDANAVVPIASGKNNFGIVGSNDNGTERERSGG